MEEILPNIVDMPEPGFPEPMPNRRARRAALAIKRRERNRKRREEKLQAEKEAAKNGG